MIGEMIKIRQKFDRKHVTDIKEAINAEIKKLNVKINEGSRIAITAGSRGIDRIPAIIRTIAQWVKSNGGQPFIVPCMGSHGGATAQGQLHILKQLGITAQSMGVPVLSSMEVVNLGTIESITGMPVVMDRNAFEADGVIVVNRIKPHTSFHADIESGILKMMVVGLGKEIQAKRLHSYGTKGLKQYIIPMARKILDTGKIIMGIGIVENAYDRVAEIKAFAPQQIENGEKALLIQAKKYMPRLPVDEVDILVVEQIGKNISGTGMDTNVIGRLKIAGEDEPEKPSIKKIVVLGMTKETNGNAYGIGLADFTTRQLMKDIDYKATYANALTTTFTERVKIPVIADDENQALKYAVQTCAIDDITKARVIRIKNTLELEEIWVSDSIFKEISRRVEALKLTNT